MMRLSLRYYVLINAGRLGVRLLIEQHLIQLKERLQRALARCFGSGERLFLKIQREKAYHYFSFFFRYRFNLTKQCNLSLNLTNNSNLIPARHEMTVAWYNPGTVWVRRQTFVTLHESCPACLTYIHTAGR